MLITVNSQQKTSLPDRGQRKKMNIRKKEIISLIVLTLILSLSPSLFAGNKKIMSMQGAKVIAERALVESIYGLKLRATESVVDMVAASFQGSTESKTSAMISGVKFENSTYDAENDIAQVTASVSLESLSSCAFRFFRPKIPPVNSL